MDTGCCGDPRNGTQSSIQRQSGWQSSIGQVENIRPNPAGNFDRIDKGTGGDQWRKSGDIEQTRRRHAELECGSRRGRGGNIIYRIPAVTGLRQGQVVGAVSGGKRKAAVTAGGDAGAARQSDSNAGEW